MNDPNNQNNGIYEGYIPPTINPTKVEPTSKKKLLVWLIVPAGLIIVAFIAAFALFYNAITGGFRAKNIETEYSINPPQWNVYGREIHGTAAKTLTGGLFWIVVQGDDEGALEIKVTDTESGKILLNKTFPHSESCTVNADGRKVEFEVTAYNFSGHFLIHEEYA